MGAIKVAKSIMLVKQRKPTFMHSGAFIMRFVSSITPYPYPEQIVTYIGIL